MSFIIPDITDFHQSVAKAHGIDLYDRYAEADAAQLLNYSLVALRRIRTTGRIGCVKPSPRKIFYFGYQLVDFLLKAVEEQSCHATPRTETTNSATLALATRRQSGLVPDMV